MDLSGNAIQTPSEGRVGALMGMGPSPSSSVKSSATATSSGTATSEKKGKKKSIESLKTYRFTMSLKSCETKGKEYDEFNWLDLIAKEEEKKANAKLQEMENEMMKARGSANPLDPYASDDEEGMKALARKFETKYGGAVDKIKKKKKERKLNDCADLGYGYDSEDSFIDNSDVHDEVVPSNITTAHGGFYINCGNLEFKERESADEDSDVEAVYREGEKAAAAKNRRRKRIINGATTADSGDEGSSVKKCRTGTANGANGSDGSATDSSSKAKARKEGAKPLGRPKKRNPGGTLVHPPKPPRPQKLDAAGLPMPRKKLPGGQQVKMRRVNKVLPPGGANNSTANAKTSLDAETKKAGLPKSSMSNGEGTKDCPIDLTAMSAPKEVPVSTTTPAKLSVTSTPVQIKTVESSPNSMIQDQLVGDTALRMLAATVSEAMMSIPPPSKPNHTAPPKQTNMPDYNSSTKRENPRNGALSNSESGKTVSVEATTIAAKKAPTKSESSQALMAKFMQSVTNTGLPGTANSLQQQTARQTTSGTQGSEALLQAANKVIEKSLSAVNKASPPKQVLQQQLQQKKADQTKKQQQQEQLQQKKKQATNSEQDRLKNLYKEYYDKMQSALARGDSTEYNRHVEALKNIMSPYADKAGFVQPQSVLKQTKPRNEKANSESFAASKGLPSGITIESISLKNDMGDRKIEL